MALEDYLPFCEGWDIDTKVSLTQVYKDNPTTLFTPRFGWIIGVGINTTDSLAEVTLIGDEFEVDVSPQFLLDSGLTTPNANFPWLSSYRYDVGTKGSFTMSFAPNRPLPLKNSFSYTFTLGTNSTQSSTLITSEVTTYYIYDRKAFLSTLKDYYQSVGLAPEPVAPLSRVRKVTVQQNPNMSGYGV